jgi:hypothetical protein
VTGGVSAESRILGGLGGAVEFCRYSAIARPVNDVRDYGTHNQAPARAPARLR